MAENRIHVEDYPLGSGLYTGELCLGQPDGQGTLAYYSGTRYEGQWKMGRYHGLGHIRWADGESYKGDFVEGQRTGHGVYRFANGNLYRGDFLNGKFHGKGTFRRADGSRMQGQWKDHAYIENSGLSTQPLTGTEMEYWELYRWWCHYRGNSPAYNDRFRRLRACGNAQEVVRSILGGNDLSEVRGEEAEFCLFLLERFAPYDADRELLARCYYLTGQIKKAAGIVAMTISDNAIHTHLNQEIDVGDGLSMEIMIAHYLKKAMDTCERKNLCFVSNGVYYDWPYVAQYQNIAAMRYMVQASYASAKYNRERLASKSRELTKYLDELVDQKRYRELMNG